jgi:hypothetical protein
MKKTFLNFGLVFALLVGVCASQVCRAQTVGDGDRSANPIPDRELSATKGLEAPPFRVFRCGNEATGDSGYPSVPDAAVQLGVTMADFTGDTHPDRATINLARFDSRGAQYFIDVELTEGGHQSLSLSAPPVALFVTARDVTGDGTPDLVVRARSSRSIVAVFLNDGCGRFFNARATASVPPVKYQFAPSNIHANQPSNTALALDQRSYEIAAYRSSERDVLAQQSPVRLSRSIVPAKTFPQPSSGRAPPAVL